MSDASSSEMETPEEHEGQEPQGGAVEPASSPAEGGTAEATQAAQQSEAVAAKADKPAAKRAKARPKAAAASISDDDASPEGEKPPAEGTAKAAGEKEAKPARTPRRKAKAAPAAPRPRTVRAHARYVRTSARKARMVCGHLRGRSVHEARAILAFTPREVARDWSKLLESAVANAESNHELLEDDLIVREAYADEGPTIKRFRPRAMGRATPILKRTSHLTIALSTRPEPGSTNGKR